MRVVGPKLRPPSEETEKPTCTVTFDWRLVVLTAIGHVEFVAVEVTSNPTPTFPFAKCTRDGSADSSSHAPSGHEASVGETREKFDVFWKN
jgi:hypothetical protein